jgi:hypothetical protein
VGSFAADAAIAHQTQQQCSSRLVQRQPQQPPTRSARAITDCSGNCGCMGRCCSSNSPQRQRCCCWRRGPQPHKVVEAHTTARCCVNLLQHVTRSLQRWLSQRGGLPRQCSTLLLLQYLGVVLQWQQQHSSSSGGSSNPDAIEQQKHSTYVYPICTDTNCRGVTTAWCFGIIALLCLGLMAVGMGYKKRCTKCHHCYILKL